MTETSARGRNLDGTTTSMRIGELAEQIGTSVRTLRHYEQQGLIAPEREPNGYRSYRAADAIRARNIKDLLATGLTSEDVREYLDQGCLDQPLGDAPRCAAELRTASSRLTHLDELIGRLQGNRDRLASHICDLERELDNPEGNRGGP